MNRLFWFSMILSCLFLSTFARATHQIRVEYHRTLATQHASAGAIHAPSSRVRVTKRR